MQQPDDHVSFLKQILLNTSQNRDNSRAVIICPPRTNCDKLAYRISISTKQVVITQKEIEDYAKTSRRDLKPAQLARVIANLVRKNEAYKHGWILVNIFKSAAEAKALLQIGILPTICLYLVSPFYPKLDELKYSDIPRGWPETRRQLIALRDTFKHILAEVDLASFNSEELAEKCIELIQLKKGKTTIKPRIILLGPRGSGRKTQAKILENVLKIVHIDFEYLLCQYWDSKTDLGIKLRECKERVCFHSELLVQVLNKRILEEDCLKYGWVLTGFPYTVTDLMFIDCVDTPPNRIIFLECDLNVCLERVAYKRTDTVTGSKVDIKQQGYITKNKEIEQHPKDKSNIVNSENIYYCEQYPKLREYCGGTSYVVNANQQERWVHESIMAIIRRESNPCPPRKPFENVEIPPPITKKSLLSIDSTCCCGALPPKDRKSVV